MLSVVWGVQDDEWRTFVNQCPNATFFHLPGWYATCEMRTDTALFEFPNGKQALLPLGVGERFRGMVREAQSGVQNGYGGLVSPQVLTPLEVESAFRYVLRRYPDLRATSNPFEAYRNICADGNQGEDKTQVLPILEREAQLKLMSATCRKQTQRGLKSSFEFAVRTPLTEADAKIFYPLYAARAAEWQYDRWVRDLAFFRKLCHHAGQNLTLFLAYREGELAGFRLLGIHGPVAMDLFLATDSKFDKDQVGRYLVAEPLAWLMEFGVSQFDFQASGRLDGVRAYKASFGAEERPILQTGFTSLFARGISLLARKQA